MASSHRAPFPWRPKRLHCKEPQRTGAALSSRGLDLPSSTTAPGARAHQPPEYAAAPGAHAPANGRWLPFHRLFTFTSEVFQLPRVPASLQVLGLNRAPSCPTSSFLSLQRILSYLSDPVACVCVCLRVLKPDAHGKFLIPPYNQGSWELKCEPLHGFSVFPPPHFCSF